jgi:hypothetical protein
MNPKPPTDIAEKNVIEDGELCFYGSYGQL